MALTAGPAVDAVPPSGLLTQRLAKLLLQEPIAAIIAAWDEVEKALRERMGAAGSPVVMHASMLAHMALQSGRISAKTKRSVDELLRLRGLATSGPAKEVDREKALDYLAIADAVLHAIQADALGPR